MNRRSFGFHTFRFVYWKWRSNVSVPIAMRHIVNGFRWPIDWTRNTGVSSCSSRIVFEVWPGLVLVTLKAIVQWPVRLVERFVGNPRPEAGTETFASRVHDVETPNGNAVIGKSQFFKTFFHQVIWYDALYAAQAGWSCQISPNVNSQIL